MDLGFINFKSKREFSFIKRLLGSSAHIEPSKGSDSQNQKYCVKENDYWEWGVPLKQGQRKDLEAVVETIRQSGRMSEVVRAHPDTYIKYHRGIEKLFGYLSERTERSWKTETIIYYGEPGTGKSRAAKEISENRGYKIYYKTRGDWWDNYNGQEAVIIDDFYGWIKYDEMLRITDRYPLQVPVKGGFTEFLAKLVIITSNRPISDWWRGGWFDNIASSALLRRVDVYENWQFISGNLIRTDCNEINTINEFLN